MTKISKFTDLEAWKEAHKLTLLVYEVTVKFPKLTSREFLISPKKLE